MADEEGQLMFLERDQITILIDIGQGEYLVSTTSLAQSDSDWLTADLTRSLACSGILRRDYRACTRQLCLPQLPPQASHPLSERVPAALPLAQPEAVDHRQLLPDVSSRCQEVTEAAAVAAAVAKPVAGAEDDRRVHLGLDA